MARVAVQDLLKKLVELTFLASQPESHQKQVVTPQVHKKPEVSPSGLVLGTHSVVEPIHLLLGDG